MKVNLPRLRQYLQGKRKRVKRRHDALMEFKRAQTNLARWQSKLKLAQTKIKKYKRRVKYYSPKAHEIQVRQNRAVVETLLRRTEHYEQRGDI